MANKIGVIAEDTSDVDVLYELTSKLTDVKNFSFKHFVGRGSGALHKKCSAWAEILIDRGCDHLVVLRDLDKNNIKTLYNDLLNQVKDVGFTGCLILIPVRELEAWLLTDAVALRNVFNMRKQPRVPSMPERVRDPKKKLRDIVLKYSGKRYVNTFHNQKIAAALQITNVFQCRSFQPYPEFISGIFGN